MNRTESYSEEFETLPKAERVQRIAHEMELSESKLIKHNCEENRFSYELWRKRFSEELAK